MNQKKNAFTLIELLAVIVILAIIALVAVPVIMNIINKANKSAFKDTAYGVISAGELYFAEQQLEPNGMLQDVTIQLPDSRLELKGEVPEGSVTITKDGKISIAVHNGRYCITKGINDKDITVTEDVENCKLPEVAKTLSEIGTTSSTCVINGQCTQAEIIAGIKVNIQVNEEEDYDFYVIADDGTNVTLMMDSNLGDKVAWYSDGDDTTEDETNSSGPLTALQYLDAQTKEWTNISSYSYTLVDDQPTTASADPASYEPFDVKNVRARMLTATESRNLGCRTGSENGYCPDWMFSGYNGGYWLSTASSSSYLLNQAQTINGSELVGYNNNIYGSENYIRPVIIIAK